MSRAWSSSESCPGCEGESLRALGAYLGAATPFLGLRLAECRSCELVFADPMPTVEDLEEYNRNYWMNAHDRGAVSTSAPLTAFNSGMAQVRVAFLLQIAREQDLRLDSVIELGPGEGEFARHFLREVRDGAYFVLESDVTLQAHLSTMGVTVLTESEFDALPTEAFAAVILSHVLEHVGDPRGLLAQTVRLLRPGGVLFIDVPCRDDVHKGLYEPHVLFFSQRSLTILLEQFELENVVVRHFGPTLRQLVGTASRARRFVNKIRDVAVRHGVTLWLGRRGSMPVVEGSLQRAMIRPFRPHLESEEPAWWLRGVATRAAVNEVPVADGRAD